MLPAGVIPSCEAMVKQRTSIVAQISKGRRYALDIVIAKERSELSGPIEFVLIANFPVDINRNQPLCDCAIKVATQYTVIHRNKPPSLTWRPPALRER